MDQQASEVNETLENEDRDVMNECQITLQLEHEILSDMCNKTKCVSE